MDDTRRRFRDLIAAGIYNRNMRRGQSVAGATPMSPAFARQSATQMTISAPESNEDYTAKTARMMMDRQYGNNDAQSPYYKGRWMAPGNPGAYLAEKVKDLARGTGGSFGGGGTSTPPDAAPAENAPMAPSYEPSMQFPQEKPTFDFSDKLRKSGSLPNGIRFGGIKPNERKKWGNF